MNSAERARLKSYGDYICKRWLQLNDPDPWKNRAERQLLQDSLIALKHFNLIKEYSMTNGVTL